MRVLFLITSGRMGGLERHVHCLVKSLPKTVESHVCVFADNGGASEAMIADGLPVTVLDGHNGHDWRALKKFVRLMREFRPDIVHIHSRPILAFVGVTLFSKVKVVVSLHLPVSLKCRDRLFSWLDRRVDYFLPVSASVWEGYKKVCPKICGEVFFNPLRICDMPEKDFNYLRCELGLSCDQKIIGYVGRMAPPKNWSGWLEVVAAVLKSRKNVHAVAIGDGEEMEMLQQRWKRLTDLCPDTYNRLHWLGQRQDAKELIGGMDVFVMTSQSEALPTMLLEAFAMRTPVVGNLPVGGAKEVLACGEHVAELRGNATVEEIAKMTLAALDRPEEMAAMAERARKVVEEHFDAERLCREQLIPIYQQVMAQKKNMNFLLDEIK